jgi:CHAT domain-containing protein
VITPTSSEFHVAAFSFEKRISEDVVQIRASLRLNKQADHPPPFAAKRAYHLYDVLIAPLRAALEDVRTVLLVESFQLRSLPLGVLLTRDPQTDTLDAADARDAPWLIRDFAFSVLPTASSLTALRLRERIIRSHLN